MPQNSIFHHLSLSSVSSAKLAKTFAFIPKVGPFVIAGVALIDFFSGFGKKSKSSASSIQQANISLSGTGRMTSFVELEGFNFKLPGASDISGSSLWKANWDNPMGVLTLLETPKIRIETFDKVITKTWTDNSYYCITPSPEEFKSGYVKQKISIKEPLKIAVNPAAGFDLSKSVIEACFELEGIVDYQSMNEQRPSSWFTVFNPTHQIQYDSDGNNVTSFEREGLFTEPRPRRINENGDLVYYNQNGNENGPYPKYRSAFVNANYLHEFNPSVSYNYSDSFVYNGFLDCFTGRNFYSTEWYQKPVVYIKLIAKLVPLGSTDPDEFTEWIGRFPTKIDPSDFQRVNTLPPAPSFSDIAESLVIDQAFDCSSPNLIVRQALTSIFVRSSQSCSGEGLRLVSPNIIVEPGVVLEANNNSEIELVSQSILPSHFNNPPTIFPLSEMASWCNNVYKNVPGRVQARLSVSNDRVVKPTNQPSSSLGYPIPNPANNTCRLPVNLAEPGAATVYISNAMGMRVGVVWENKPLPAGEHNINIPLENLEPGVYYITVQHEGFKQARRLMVVR